MSWQGMRWMGTDADLQAANRQSAENMAAKQDRARELAYAALVAKGRC
jgi:hypothetical protein